MSKKQQLEVLTKKLEAAASKLPLAKTARDIVPGEGNPQAKIIFIGEAAGYHESVQRRPFVGAAGKLLTHTLKDNNFKRQDVYISNILKVRPPNNRDPLPSEIKAYAPFLDAEIKIIQPKIIVTLGRFSMNKFLPNVKISQVHGQPRWVNFQNQKILIMPMYHPAAALRSGFILKQFQDDFAKLPQILDTIENKSNGEIKPVIQKEEPKKEAQTQLSLI